MTKDQPATKGKKALVVFSGGQDSTTCLYWAKKHFEEVVALIVNYGQKHAVEVQSAHMICQLLGVEPEIVHMGPILSGRSPLTDPTAPLETYASAEVMEQTIGNRVELTFVPMRNAMFLTLAANKAICMDAYDIVTGVCQADNANYPDCRADFIQAQQDAINEALGLVADIDDPRAAPRQVRIHTPLMDMSKAEGIALALTLPGCYAALGYSHTAYSGEYPPITQDHATVLRADGFAKAGVPDPLIIKAWWEGLVEMPQAPNYTYWLDKGLRYQGFMPGLSALDARSPHAQLLILEGIINEFPAAPMASPAAEPVAEEPAPSEPKASPAAEEAPKGTAKG